MPNLQEIPLLIEGTLKSRVFSSKNLFDVTPLIMDEKSLFIVYDKAVEEYAIKIRSDLSGDVTMIPLSVSEEEKTLSSVEIICDRLLWGGADRSSLLLAIGGGITSDMAGFAACIYRRGIRFAFIPTTLLSQVDAAIGGKTGVNFLDYKNMLGIIRQPEFTFICPEVLESLPYRDFLGGASEMIKSFILDEDKGPLNYPEAVSVLSKIKEERIDTFPYEPMGESISCHKEELFNLIHEAALVKTGIVGRDPEEKGERRKLNLGHTFAHAIEHEARTHGEDITHGEAVSIGMVLAARLGAALGLCRPSFPSRLAKDLELCSLPVSCPFPIRNLAAAMTLDKKSEGGIVHFVIPKCVGEVTIRDLRVQEAVSLLENAF